jgi:hypothetical protein
VETAKPLLELNWSGIGPARRLPANPARSGNGLLRVQWVAGAWLKPSYSETSENKTYGFGDHCRATGGLPRRLDICDAANAGIVAA